MKPFYHLIIIGAGAGGFSAAVAAARSNPDLHIALIEQHSIPGGTATIGGVNNWEPGFSSPSFHKELEEILTTTHGGGVGHTEIYASASQPCGISKICPAPYILSLRRAGLKPDEYYRYHFEPLAMSKAMEEILKRYPNIDFFPNTTYLSCCTQDGILHSLTIQCPDHSICTLHANYFIDSTGNLAVARDAGCDTLLGTDSHEQFLEPSAPSEASLAINGATLVFRITPKNSIGVDPIPKEYQTLDLSNWKDTFLSKYQPACFITEYPNGDYCMNMLPTLSGSEVLTLDPASAYALARERVYAYWHWLQTINIQMQRFMLSSIAPVLACRESYRLLAKYMLKEQDLAAPFGKQDLFSHSIAFADHPIDVHGENGALRSLSHPYGIPYETLFSPNVKNLLIASKCIGLSHIAAASCRLTRTIMAIGNAAGIAVSLCSQKHLSSVSECPIKLLTSELAIEEQINEIQHLYLMD